MHHSVAPRANRRASDSAARRRTRRHRHHCRFGDRVRSTPLRVTSVNRAGRPSLATVRPSPCVGKVAVGRSDVPIDGAVSVRDDGGPARRCGRSRWSGGARHLRRSVGLRVVHQDADGRIARWNRGAERIFGYSEDEIVGEALTSLAPPHLRSSWSRWAIASPQANASTGSSPRSSARTACPCRSPCLSPP